MTIHYHTVHVPSPLVWSRYYAKEIGTGFAVTARSCYVTDSMSLTLCYYQAVSNNVLVPTDKPSVLTDIGRYGVT
jgi:hypothetical protein